MKGLIRTAYQYEGNAHVLEQPEIFLVVRAGVDEHSVHAPLNHGVDGAALALAPGIHVHEHGCIALFEGQAFDAAAKDAPVGVGDVHHAGGDEHTAPGAQHGGGGVLNIAHLPGLFPDGALRRLGDVPLSPQRLGNGNDCIAGLLGDLAQRHALLPALSHSRISSLSHCYYYSKKVFG